MANKKSFINVNDMIWCDEDLRRISTGAALRFLFAIAWSKGNRKDGWFSDFAFQLCGGTPAELNELLASGLVISVAEPRGYAVRTYEEWQNTNAEVVAISARQSAGGKVGMTKRWGKPVTKVEPDGSFDAEQAGAECFALWPEQLEPKWREKRTEAISAFTQSITADDYEAFKSALAHRLQAYGNEPGHDRRRFLGAFKNFCIKWQDWIPKDYGVEVVAESTPTPYVPQDDLSDPEGLLIQKMMLQEVV